MFTHERLDLNAIRLAELCAATHSRVQTVRQASRAPALSNRATDRWAARTQTVWSRIVSYCTWLTGKVSHKDLPQANPCDQNWSEVCVYSLLQNLNQTQSIRHPTSLSKTTTPPALAARNTTHSYIASLTQLWSQFIPEDLAGAPCLED